MLGGPILGSVSQTAYMYLRLLALIFGGITLVFTLVFLVALLAVGATLARELAPHRTTELHVVKVLEPFTWEPSALPYAVRADDGVDYYFREDPRLRLGDSLTVERDGRGRYVAAVVRGRRVPAATGSRAVPEVLLPLLIAVPALAFGLNWWRLRRRMHAVESDRRAGPTAVTGTYLGSYLPWQLAWRASLGSLAFNDVLGFPLLLRDDATGFRRWLHAPLTAAGDIKEFEERIKEGDRHVTAECYVRTGVLRSLRSDAGAAVEIGRGEEAWPAERGLPIR